jgi:transcriptional regulator PpsR
MEAQGSSPVLGSSTEPLFRRGKLEHLDASVTARIVAASGDVVLVIDRHGLIFDMAISNQEMARDGAASWMDQSWSDTVTLDSRHKVEELLRDAVRNGRTQWREINQITPNLNSVIVRYQAFDAGREGQVVAIGRDDRATAVIQQRLLEAQQSMERDYSRLRDAESRYRLLFHLSGEPVMVVDSITKKIIEANPAAERLVVDGKSKLTGEVFARIFDPPSQNAAASLLIVVQTAARGNSQMRLSCRGSPCLVWASLFRHDGATQCLIRLTPAEQTGTTSSEPGRVLESLLEKMPDAFLVTDGSLKILTANAAFLDLVRVATKEQAIGQSLSQFLGRAGLERSILVDNLREYGSVRNFGTVVRNQFDGQEDVEVSAVSVSEGAETFFGFAFRNVRRRQNDPSRNPPELRRSVEQLTELVGRVKLKDIVRETTDLVERLCIEAALELTKDNRASAAEILGLSRQSLYSKLHRFGLGNLSESDN